MRELTSQEICLVSGGKDVTDTIVDGIVDGLRAITGALGSIRPPPPPETSGPGAGTRA